ncbi:MAG: 3-phosphoshikimate 1-carboxyvinyltransferase [Oscillospiraceae bacterium]|nr:3-phosphoshikimate 1-carboxyvinyltransferase [Oscillospiraceae bacterium]
MTVTIYPSVPVGTVKAPPSKSMAHRLLICAGLAKGGSRVRGVAPSDDVLATIDCLRALGASVDIDGETALVRGADPRRAVPGVLNCRESGSTLRFFTPLCALSGRETVLEGSGTLFRRPLEPYEDLFRERGLLFAKTERSLTVRGPLGPGTFELPGDVSSQFISGLLFTLPLLEGDSVIRLRPPVESRAYTDMTLSALGSFGVNASWNGDLELLVPGGQEYLPRDVSVEGDWSNAAFFLAMGADVTGLDPDSLQGDKVCAEHFAVLDRGHAEIDISGCPDLGPVLMACAALKSGGTFTGTRRLALKESDRGAAMAEELGKFGVRVSVEENRITVSGGAKTPSEPLSGHDDHRIVMALSVLCTRTGGTIEGAEAVSKSFPDFFERLKDLNVRMDVS